MSNSIIIFGKGPSVLRCTREYVNNIDDICIINFPLMNDHFTNLINDRDIKYHFCNCATFDDRYTDTFNSKYNIKNIYNTHYKNEIKNYYNFLFNKIIFKDSIREVGEKYIKDHNFNFDPNSGILSLIYVINTYKYNNITLVGFDNFIPGNQTYYYEPKEYNDKIKYLIDKNIISSNGIFNINSGHDTKITEEFLIFLFKKNKDITFNLITNINFKEDISNVKIL